MLLQKFSACELTASCSCVSLSAILSLSEIDHTFLMLHSISLFAMSSVRNTYVVHRSCFLLPRSNVVLITMIIQRVMEMVSTFIVGCFAGLHCSPSSARE